MKRHALTFGIVGGILVTVLRWSEYRFLVIEHSFEIYGGLIAAIFAILGIWLGVRLTGPRPKDSEPKVPVPAHLDQAQPEAPSAQAIPVVLFNSNEKKREDLGITRRELEVLGLIAQGMSNREIAGKLFVSENTVKTHSSRVFDKLGARRRTQAVQLGKELGLLP
ncbi:MAG: LuxR C-terminal-related transcriptional regulator [Terracidiphilus sp.]